ncbi:MAG: DUF4914 family protein, partial [Bacteroidales bacterium]|nr:DUF4914 family protein [Bacteroidales bacterium]
MEAKEAVALVEGQGVRIPGEILSVITSSPRAIFFNSPRELYEESLGGGDGNHFEVKYDVPGKGLYTEAVVHRVSNGISANYPEPYMRRRDPDTMLIGDTAPTDKQRFSDAFSYDFGELREE